MRTEAPLVGTGMERRVAIDSGVCVIASAQASVESVDAERIVVRATSGQGDEVPDIYHLTKYQRSNQSTCYNQKPIVAPGEVVKAGDVLADGPAATWATSRSARTCSSRSCRGRATTSRTRSSVSERIVKDDVYTSIHIEEFECVARDTKLGKEEITKDIPNVGEEALKDLDDAGVVRIGAEVKPGDILVGKITPKGESQLSPEEKLSRAIFGEKAGDVRDSSLKVPPGVGGIVINARIFSRKGTEKDEARGTIEDQERAKLERTPRRGNEDPPRLRSSARSSASSPARPRAASWSTTRARCCSTRAPCSTDADARGRFRASTGARSRSRRAPIRCSSCSRDLETMIREREEHFQRQDRSPEPRRRAAARRDQDGEGLHRHQEEAAGGRQDGRSPRQQGRASAASCRKRTCRTWKTVRPVDIVLNPLGVPSRMNVGQILETHLGWGARELGRQIQASLDEQLRSRQDPPAHHRLVRERQELPASS